MSEETATCAAVWGKKAKFVVSMKEHGFWIRNEGTMHNAWGSETRVAEAVAIRKFIFNIQSVEGSLPEWLIRIL